MRRGDVVAVVAAGDFGKSRPAVIVQTDALARAGSVIVCLFTSHLVDAPTIRIQVAPDQSNGLEQPSQIMADKVVTVARSRIGKVIGRLDDETLLRLNRTLAFVIGLGQ